MIARFASALLALALSAAAAAACPLEGLQAARDLPTVRTAFAEVLAAGAGCTAAQRDWAGRIVALHHHLAAEAALRSGDAPGALLLLDQGLGTAVLWQSLALRGDLRQRLPGLSGEPDFARASLDYQAALNAIEAGDPRSDPVDEATIASLWRRAEQTRMLAGRPVPSPPTRSGQAGGLGLRGVRSFAPVTVAMPIQFVFARCEFTAGGQIAADDLWSLLDGEGRPAIRLVGHTDPVGGDEFNMRLSLCRAVTVRNFLVQRGYPARMIEVDGRGERSPLLIEQRDGYTEAQIHQILRRVELVRR